MEPSFSSAFERGVHDAQTQDQPKPDQSQAYLDGFYMAKQQREQQLDENERQRGVEI